MRFYIGHRLPLGFYAGVGFGSYRGSRPTHVVHADGSTTPVKGPSILVTLWNFLLFVLIFVVPCWWLFQHYHAGLFSQAGR